MPFIDVDDRDSLTVYSQCYYEWVYLHIFSHFIVTTIDRFCVNEREREGGGLGEGEGERARP